MASILDQILGIARVSSGEFSVLFSYSRFLSLSWKRIAQQVSGHSISCVRVASIWKVGGANEFLKFVKWIYDNDVI